MKKKQKRTDEEFNFWQPASDMFSALLLILMLVILLLGLYLVQIPEHNQVDPWAGDAFVKGDWDGEGFTPHPTEMFWPHQDADGGGGGGGHTPHPTYSPRPTGTLSPSPSPTVSPTPDLEGGGATGGGGGDGGGNGAGEGPGEEPDMGLKSAVFVMIVDAESDRTIKIPHVEFELYGNNHALQVLNTYYPERITYRVYETTEAGTFYFPEKLMLGAYELHELTEPEGYDISDNIEFVLAETYDWSDPLVVRVPLYPSRNVIRVQMNDAETGGGIPGGSFDVIAKENVITADGTLRYRAGQKVAQIDCDETGYGVSEPIYLGQYLLRQSVIPAYYTSVQEDIEVEVAKQSKVEPPLTLIASERTKIIMTVRDELYPTRTVAGAEFSVSVNGLPSDTDIVMTDGAGQFLLDTLEKNTTYQISQVRAPDDYQVNRQTISVHVAADGRIENESRKDLELLNHVIRVSIGITDEFSSIQVPNISLSLYNGQDHTLVRTWTTTASPLMFTDLHEGTYYVIKNGETENRYDLYVHDQAQVQEVTLHTSYVLRYVIMIGSAIAALILLILLTVVLVRYRRKKRAARE